MKQLQSKLFTKEQSCKDCKINFCTARPNSIECFNNKATLSKKELTLASEERILSSSNKYNTEIQSTQKLRLQIEIEDLEEKIKKLQTYYDEQVRLNNMTTFSKNETVKTIRISKTELNYIKIQLGIMNSLLSVLKARLEFN